MKKTLQTLGIVLCCVLYGQQLRAQSQFIVDNNPNGLKTHDSVTEAIAVAVEGDVIIVMPSPTKYSNFTVSKNGIKIAGGGANGQLGEYTHVGTITISPSVSNVSLGGMRCDQIVALGADKSNLNIQAMNVDGLAEFNGAPNLRIGYSVFQQLRISNSDNVVVHQSEIDFTGNNGFTKSSGDYLDIVNCQDFVITNTLFKEPSLTIDANSKGLFSHGSLNNSNGNANTAWSFGGDETHKVHVTNSIFMSNSTGSWTQTLAVSGGTAYLNNAFWSLDNSYTLPDTVKAITTTQSENPYGNFRTATFVYTDANSLTTAVTASTVNAGREDAQATDIDGSRADIGAYGGLNPMPTVIPSEARFISILPSVTKLQLSPPSSLTNGTITVKSSGQSKRN